jgi:hypothetical protein
LLLIVGLSLRVIGAGAALLVTYSHLAWSEVPDGTWLLADRVAVEVFDCSGLVCGRIVWLVKPRTPDGEPDLDHMNPDPALRQRPLCGLTIIWGLQPDGPDNWSNGSLYDRRTATSMMSPRNASRPTGYRRAFIAGSRSLAAPRS